MRSAHEVEEQKLKSVDELEAVKAKIEQARKAAAADEAVASTVGVAPGMTVDQPVEAEEEEDPNAEPLPPKKMPERKTKKQRKTAERLRAEVTCFRF